MCLHRNLISGILINKSERKTILGDDKAVISHNRVYVGKGYLNGSLFVFNITFKTMNANASISTYIVESVDL